MSPIGIVQGIDEAFGRRDVPAILEQLADNVQWEYGVNSTNVPWLQPRGGRADVVGFFQSVADLDCTVRATGRRIVEEDEAHIWRFNADGKVSRFRHRVDSHQHWTALEQK